MIEAVILRLDAPLMSFGGPVVDQIGRTRRFPGLSQITGLLGNALGYDHAEPGRLERLQARLRIASLLLRPGRELMDYQTVDLGQAHLVDTGWTTRGRREGRGKGEATSGTHIRERHYRAGSVVLSAIALDPPEEEPDLAAIAAALRFPARPLFIGRKTCLPASLLLVGEVQAADLAQALTRALEWEASWGLVPCRDRDGPFDAELPARGDGKGLSAERVVDHRDWRNQFHDGERVVRPAKLSRADGTL